MDPNRWVEIEYQQPPPNPIPPTIPYTQYQDTHYPYHLAQPRIRNPNRDDATLWNPIVDSYSPIYSSQPHHQHPSHVGGGDAQTTMGYAHHHLQNRMSALPYSAAIPPVETYYPDPTGVTQSWPVQQVVYKYVAEPVSVNNADARVPTRMNPVVPTNPNPLYLNNPAVQQPTSGTKRKLPKKGKTVQSAWCEICQVDCTCSDVLKKHKRGKKHHKNLEKLEAAKRNAYIAVAATPTTMNDASSSREDLETKRRKMMEEGADAQAVRMCQICNVVCNSDVVFRFHLNGQKHAAMVKKHGAAV